MITDKNRPDRWGGRLGYQLVSERAVLRFGPATGPMPRRSRPARCHGCPPARCRGCPGCAANAAARLRHGQDATASARVTSVASSWRVARTRSRRCSPPPAGRPRWRTHRRRRPAPARPPAPPRPAWRASPPTWPSAPGRARPPRSRAPAGRPPRLAPTSAEPVQRAGRPGRAVHRPLLPPRPRLLGHERQERREQPQQHAKRQPQRPPRRRRRPRPAPYARAFTSSR